jgi:hypothetical protein
VRFHPGIKSKKDFCNLILSAKSLEPTETQLYSPDLNDLYSLYSRARDEGSVAVIEYGSGWSTLALGLAVYENKLKFGTRYLANVRHPNPFRLLTVDASEDFQNLALNRIPPHIRDLIDPIVTPARLSTHNGQICSFFVNVPAFTADFVYLDGPDCDQVEGNIDGFSPNFGSDSHRYGLPMSADVLRLENYFWPGTLLVTDGRGANAQFIKNNLRRNWLYKYDRKLDQHFFRLREKSWGVYSKLHLEYKK